jgi:hypothetical protein
MEFLIIPQQVLLWYLGKFPSFSVINVHDKTIRTLVLNVRMAAMIDHDVLVHSDLPEENPSTLDERLPGHRCVLALLRPFFHCFSSSKVLSLLFLVYFVVLFADFPEENPSTLDERLPGHRYVVALSTSFFCCFSFSKMQPLRFLVNFVVLYSDLEVAGSSVCSCSIHVIFSLFLVF